MRVVGLADLALVPGLVRGKRRWPWMAGRGVLNLLIAVYIRWLAQREDSTSARVVALILVGLTLADGTLGWRLGAEENRRHG
jgi:hypothetical protein